MSIATLRLDESTKLEFGVSITGASGEPETRLVIEGNQFSVSYPCKMTEHGVEAKISELKSVLPAGTYPIKLEVVIENKIYVPFEDTITFEPAIEVVTKPQINPVQIKESIKVNSVVINQIPSKTPVVETTPKMELQIKPVERKMVDPVQRMLSYVQRFVDSGVDATRIKKKLEYAFNAGKFDDANEEHLTRACSVIDEGG